MKEIPTRDFISELPSVPFQEKMAPTRWPIGPERAEEPWNVGSGVVPLSKLLKWRPTGKVFLPPNVLASSGGESNSPQTYMVTGGPRFQPFAIEV